MAIVVVRFVSLIIVYCVAEIIRCTCLRCYPKRTRGEEHGLSPEATEFRSSREVLDDRGTKHNATKFR
jgi:hypothetical protein